MLQWQAPEVKGLVSGAGGARLPSADEGLHEVALALSQIGIENQGFKIASRPVGIARRGNFAGKLTAMHPTEFRLELLAALQENGRETTDGLMALVGAEDKGLGYEETKAALDGLLDTDLVVWEAGGENHLWRISTGGRDYLASARKQATRAN
ncbi:MAG TPA: hypothetical protein VID51_03810 [Solirubrobacterales bacterium]